jgi:hypothetical protein
MRQPIDQKLLDQIRDHKLRFTCGDCLYFTPGGTCAHFWPNHDHRRVPVAGDLGKDLVFCKEFDLG